MPQKGPTERHHLNSSAQPELQANRVAKHCGTADEAQNMIDVCALQANRMAKHCGAFRAVDDLSFDVAR